MKHDDAGKLVLRVALGVLILLHGIAKLRGGVGGIAGMLGSHGLPGFIAYGAYVGEVIAPVLVILGLYTRLAGAVIAFNMVIAFLLAHTNNFFSLNPNTGGWIYELPGMFLFASIAVALLGAGRFAIGKPGRWN